MKVKLEFSGGMELLFDKQKEIAVELPVSFISNESSMRDLLPWIRDYLLSEKAELFMSQETM